jgi:hypothetical protein
MCVAREEEDERKEKEQCHCRPVMYKNQDQPQIRSGKRAKARQRNTSQEGNRVQNEVIQRLIII